MLQISKYIVYGWRFHRPSILLRDVALEQGRVPRELQPSNSYGTASFQPVDQISDFPGVPEIFSPRPIEFIHGFSQGLFQPWLTRDVALLELCLQDLPELLRIVVGKRKN